MMKKLFLILFVMGVFFPMENGFCAQRSSFLKTKNVGGEDVISKYKDGKILFVRHDSAFVADMDENGNLVNLTYTEELDKISPEGQVAYGNKSGKLYYSKSGKLFTAKQKKTGEWTMDKPVKILGSGVERDKYRGSVMAYANWRYMPNDSVVVLNPTLNEDETVMYFASNMYGSKSLDIFKVEKDVDGEWGVPQRMDVRVNSSSDENYPFLADDGSLTFGSNRPARNAKPDDNKYDVYGVNPQGTSKPRLLADIDEEAARKLQEEKRLEEERLLAEKKRQEEAARAADSSALSYVQDVDRSSDQNKRIENALNNSKPAVDRKRLNEALKKNPDTALKVSPNVVATKEMRIFYFEFDKDIPNGTYKEDFEVVLDFINSYPNSQFLLVGHTDERGSYEYNDVLSLKRAEWVQFHLLMRDVKLNRLKVRGDGEYHPIVKNAKTEEEHQKNRRVEIIKLN